MKKTVLFLYINLLVCIFSKTIEKIKNSYEYILGESIWGMIIVFPLELILFFTYSFKEILFLIFKDIERKSLDKFIFCFFGLLLLLSFVNFY